MEDEDKKPAPAPEEQAAPAPEAQAEDGTKKASEMYDQLKKEGKSDDDILAALYIMFAKGEIKEDDLKALVGALGYEFSPQFANMPDDQKKTAGIPGLDLSGEKNPEGAAAPEAQGAPENPGDKPDDKEPDGDGDDKKNDEEKSEAFRLMGIHH